jgi:hypothetical protein
VSFIRLSQDCGILFAVAMGPFVAFAMRLAAMGPLPLRLAAMRLAAMRLAAMGLTTMGLTTMRLTTMRLTTIRLTTMRLAAMGPFAQ